MDQTEVQEGILVSDVSWLTMRLASYLDSILTKNNTEAQATSIPELGRLLLELYQTEPALPPIAPPMPVSRTQAVIFRQGRDHEDDCTQ